ncbi:tagatose 1,6-diphosphate aldolase [Lacticaseibacillus zhaodongensis]|uniref:tagatose 1,6-diphosphate aldolase n=1 Tax=Lacticaseibacillus zhaodongensis TaxID=2668065 RepID=UPI0012D325E2|nr:tagatose 1,6-diphosphate aldolase [Lacticaseibacillus zhaodongensis]
MAKKTITRGKFDKLQQLSNKNGVIAALAIDQRGSMKKMMKAADDKAGAEYSLDQIYKFKELVSKELTKYASSILTDEELGFKAMTAKDPNSGLILSYEKTGYDVTTVGRFPELLHEESMTRLAAKGADAAKVLVYYNPHDKPEINNIKHAFVERLANEARGADLPLFLEIVTYDDEIPDAKSYEYAKAKPSLVLDAMKEFTKSKYGVDVIKAEVPVNWAFVEGHTADGVKAAYTEEEAAKYFKEMNDIVDRPFIYLSAGVSAQTFREELTFAGEAGNKFNGILCGRATWRDGIQVFADGGEEALTKWLETTGKGNVEELNAILDKYAKPWYEWYGGLDNINVVDPVVTD